MKEHQTYKLKGILQQNWLILFKSVQVRRKTDGGNVPDWKEFRRRYY